MKAVRLNELGGPEKLHVEEIPDPVAGPGEIVVKISRAAFNRRDVFITQGLYPGIELPKTLGSDGAGVVASLGEGVSGPAVGTPVIIDPEIGWSDTLGHAYKGASVLGMPMDGTFAEYVLVPAPNVYKKPASLSDDEAAAIPLAGETAYRAVFTRGQIHKDDAVLITGVGSGVQTFALLYAKHAGARTIVTSGSDEKLERAKALGADVAINYKTNPDWHKEARTAAGGGGPSLIIDSTGGETFARCLDIARHEARRRVRRHHGRCKDPAFLDFLETLEHHGNVDGKSERLCGDAGALRGRLKTRRRQGVSDGSGGRRSRTPGVERTVRKDRTRDFLGREFVGGDRRERRVEAEFRTCDGGRFRIGKFREIGRQQGALGGARRPLQLVRAHAAFALERDQVREDLPRGGWPENRRDVLVEALHEFGNRSGACSERFEERHLACATVRDVFVEFCGWIVDRVAVTAVDAARAWELVA